MTTRSPKQHFKEADGEERLSILLDEASFQEPGALATHQSTDFGMAEQRYPGDG